MWDLSRGSPYILGLCKVGGRLRELRAGLVVWESWWAHQDSNLGPSDYESDALTN